MAIVKAFRAVRYNPAKTDLTRVVSPPYDIISPAKQDELHARSPYNFTHVDFRKDVPGEDKYARSASILEDWIRGDIMSRDPSPAVYLYRQEYSIKGEKKVRFGFLALLKLEDGANNVHGHEHTHAAAKEDRSRLISKIKANMSPIFVVFEDKKRLMEQNLKPCAQGSEPAMDVTDDDRIRHTIWRVEDPQVLERVSAKMKGEDIFIADGHHRYEVSCAYQAERRAACRNFTGEEDFNYILAYFTNINAPGLTILPIHRIVRLLAAPDWAMLESRLKEFFSVDEVKDREKFQFYIQKAGQREHAVGLYGAGRCRLLRLKNIRWPDKIMADKSPEYRMLDVAILNTLVFDRVLGIQPESYKGVMSYTADADEAMKAADEEATRLAFIMNPTRMDQIVKVALNGEKMPQKSTYFYPKVLSGLVVNKFEETC